MAGSLIERALGLLELLASDARGLPLQQLADRLDIPKSAAHRMLAELIRLGYVRQDDDTSRYRLSTRLAALGFRFLASSGVVDLVQPVLDGLARETGELVRLGVIEGDRQTWIAKSQGATSGLRYDPDMGREAPLFYTASGHAWLASLSDKAALALVERNEAPLGIVYGSDAVASKGVKVVGTFPEASHQKVEYPLAIVDGHRNAAVSAFYDYLKGPEASAIFKRYGFTTR